MNSNLVKSQWKFLKRAGIAVGSLKTWARKECERKGPWADECTRWLASK